MRQPRNPPPPPLPPKGNNDWLLYKHAFFILCKKKPHLNIFFKEKGKSHKLSTFFLDDKLLCKI